jgi:tetratricopeptide (TPR) repeat protein
VLTGFEDEFRALLRLALVCAAVAIGCDASRPAPRAPAPSAEELVLAPQAGDHAIDQRIRELQRRIPTSKVKAQELERLGWTFVARAREAGDPGAYNLALAAASAIDAHAPGSHAALLLRGHALHSLHHFAEAERVARRLVAARGMAADHGLLGDVLVDRGEIEQATAAYQQMMDLRPDAHSYARAAHVRYLKGDLDGALEAMLAAARAASPRNRESFAWTWARLASYQLQSGDAQLARQSVERALEIFPDSQAALRMSALLHLAGGAHELAVRALRRATARSPHPELLWMLAEALDPLAPAQAQAVRADLLATGASEDPRAFALYLASRGDRLELAERLVTGELAERKDVYSYEALAWVQSAKGQHAVALQSARRSLAEGTEDPRLYYHAGLVARRAGAAVDAERWLARARTASSLLLPSQRAVLGDDAASR